MAKRRKSLNSKIVEISRMYSCSPESDAAAKILIMVKRAPRCSKDISWYSIPCIEYRKAVQVQDVLKKHEQYGRPANLGAACCA